MPTADAIIDALGIAEDAVLDALRALPATWPAKWGVLAEDARVSLGHKQGRAGQVAYTAQHQDGGGQRRLFVNAQMWEGLVTVKAWSRAGDEGAARRALARIPAAMDGLTAPEGYAISARFQGTPDLPRELIHARGLIYRVSVRRTA